LEFNKIARGKVNKQGPYGEIYECKFLIKIVALISLNRIGNNNLKNRDKIYIMTLSENIIKLKYIRVSHFYGFWKDEIGKMQLVVEFNRDGNLTLHSIIYEDRSIFNYIFFINLINIFIFSIK
jgi:hypothetical protein